jgi:WD40 repeat protein
MKGYEFEIYEAHKLSVRFIAFIPNQGVMISIDDGNQVAIWDLKNLAEDPKRVSVPSEENIHVSKRSQVSTALYAPTFLSSELANHKNVFIAMSNGSIYVLDW